METTKIILVDDNKQFRESIKDLIINVLKFEVVGEAENGSEFLKLPNLNFDIILMDLSMPELNGFEATKKFLWGYPKSNIIAVTNNYEDSYLLELIQCGFKGCIFKYNIFNDLLPAIKTVISGKYWFPKNIILKNSKN